MCAATLKNMFSKIHSKFPSTQNIFLTLQISLKNVEDFDKKERLNQILQWDIEIESSNNFNTAAGLASSSSGLSCLGFALANVFGI